MPKKVARGLGEGVVGLAISLDIAALSGVGAGSMVLKAGYHSFEKMK